MEKDPVSRGALGVLFALKGALGSALAEVLTSGSTGLYLSSLLSCGFSEAVVLSSENCPLAQAVSAAEFSRPSSWVKGSMSDLSSMYCSR